MTQSPYIPALHRIAILTAIATFPLIFMGGLVTSHGAGMSVPDWPNSYGYNMFTFPPSKWVGGIFYEHTHRLMGTVVGLLSIVLTIAAWKLESLINPLARDECPGAVIFQGILGGLRVIWVNLDLAIVHACFAQAFFCLATSVAIATSKWWIEAPKLVTERPQAGRRLFALAVACVLAVFLQLIVGAVMRHEKAGLAIPDLPLAYGKLLPPTTATGLDAINSTRAYRLQLDPVSLWQVWLHFGHRIGAIVVSTILSVTAGMALLRFRTQRHLAAPAIALLALLLLQITLGVLTVLWRKPADIASAHVACGALVLVTSFVLAMRTGRLFYTFEGRTSPATADDGRAYPGLVAA